MKEMQSTVQKVDTTGLSLVDASVAIHKDMQALLHIVQAENDVVSVDIVSLTGAYTTMEKDGDEEVMMLHKEVGVLIVVIYREREGGMIND